MMQETKLVIFDCDGVLVDSEAISARVLVGELAKFDIVSSEQEVFDRFVGRSITDVLTALNMPTQGEVFERFTVDLHTALSAAFTTELSAMRGVAEVISHLNVPCCVATSSSRPRTMNSLTVSGLKDAFGDRVFTASQVRNGKPAPDLFLFAAEKMGIAPDACLVIEDSLPGVQAGLAAQMAVWRFTGGAHFARMKPDRLATPLAIPTFNNWERFFEMAPHLRTG